MSRHTTVYASYSDEKLLEFSKTAPVALDLVKATLGDDGYAYQRLLNLYGAILIELKERGLDSIEDKLAHTD